MQEPKVEIEATAKQISLVLLHSAQRKCKQKNVDPLYQFSWVNQFNSINWKLPND